MVGFCYGGGIANFLATRVPDLGAAVPFYGAQPAAEDVAKIKAPLLIHYAGSDDRINAGWPADETALKAAGVKYQAYIYPGVQHGFNNDTTPRAGAPPPRSFGRGSDDGVLQQEPALITPRRGRARRRGCAGPVASSQ